MPFLSGEIQIFYSGRHRSNHHQPSNQWSDNQYGLVVDRADLEGHLGMYRDKLVEGEGKLKGLDDVRGRIERKVGREVRAFKWGVGAVVAAQFGGMAYFVLELGWDLMEPVAYLMTVTTTIVSSGIYVLIRREPSFENLGSWARNLLRGRLIRKFGFDERVYERVRREVSNFKSVLDTFGTAIYGNPSLRINSTASTTRLSQSRSFHSTIRRLAEEATLPTHPPQHRTTYRQRRLRKTEQKDIPLPVSTDPEPYILPNPTAPTARQRRLSPASAYGQNRIGTVILSDEFLNASNEILGTYPARVLRPASQRIFDSLQSFGFLSKHMVKDTDGTLKAHHAPHLISYGKAESLAYLAVRTPATYAPIQNILLQLRKRLPTFAPKTMLDYATGPGGAIWASNSIFPSIQTSTGVDISEHMLDLAEKILEGKGSP
ncbi:Methyltransferase-like protein 17, mitochondrial, partial [Rhizophlyctis rosea]